MTEVEPFKARLETEARILTSRPQHISEWRDPNLSTSGTCVKQSINSTKHGLLTKSTVLRIQTNDVGRRVVAGSTLPF